MIRRFVNLVAENYKTGVYSLHRLDVSKHLFHQSRADARVVPFLAQAHDNSSAGGDEGQPMLDRLPSAMTTWSSSNVDYFSLLGSRCEEGRILCLNKAGTAVLYDPHSNSNFIMPRLNKFKGPVHVSVSVAPAGDKEERLYIMHGGPDGLELNFNVLRYGPPLLCPWSNIKVWYWQSLPVPPFVDDPQYKPGVISAYTVVDGGNTICLSSVAEGAGTYYLNTVTREWKRAGDWVLPFTGKAEYTPDLNLWLGFSLRSPGFLCAASDLSDMHMDHRPMSPIVWPDHTPKEWMTVNAKLLSLGSGKFAVAKVFKAVSVTEEPGLFSERDTVEDEVVVLSGVELEFRGKDNNSLRGLKLFQHKSICYTCANSTAIRCVL